jgi:hypothetical protein
MTGARAGNSRLAWLSRRRFVLGAGTAVGAGAAAAERRGGLGRKVLLWKRRKIYSKESEPGKAERLPTGP